MHRTVLFALAILVTSCQSNRVVLERAIITTGHMRAAIALEREFALRDTLSPPGDSPWFEVIHGSSRVIVTAPHATRPIRNGKRRAFTDAGTGSLALMLQRLNDVTVIHTNYHSPTDPNYYDDNAFKDSLRAVVSAIRPTIVIDLHASHSYRPYDVDLGTMNGESLLGRGDLRDLLVTTLRREGVLNFSDGYFGASREGTITRFVSELGTPAMQVELSSAWLDLFDEGRQGAHKYSQLLQGLSRFIAKVDETSR